MSLYSDNAPDQDPYQALTVALGKPAESKEQVEALLVVSDLLDNRPAGVTEFCLPLFEAIKHTGDTALKRWVLNSIAFGLGRSSLSMEVKTTSTYRKPVKIVMFSKHVVVVPRKISCIANLSLCLQVPDLRTPVLTLAVASTVLSDMVQLLQDPSPAIVKLAVQCLSCMYPLLFRSL